MFDKDLVSLKIASFLRIWLALNLISIPIEYRLFPSPGPNIHDFLLPINRLLCYNLFGIDIEQTYRYSDSAGFYSMALLLAFVAGLCMIVKPWIKSLFETINNRFFRNSSVLSEINSNAILNYLLAYFMLRYGFDKIIGNQFYFPAPNIQHTELGNLSKDILYWSTMGTSKNYNYFMAGMEIMAGLLLLLYRTRFLGLLVTFGVLLNVFAVNIGFDISVKFLSGSLLIACAVLLFDYSEQLKFLIGASAKVNEPNKPARVRSKVVLKVLVIGLIFIELLSPAFQQGELLFYSKSYDVQEFSGDSQKLALGELKRLHFHPNGYLITEDHLQNFQSFPIIPVDGGFRVVDEKIAFHVKQNRLIWTEENCLAALKIQEIALRKKNIANDSYHWFVEKLIE